MVIVILMVMIFFPHCSDVCADYLYLVTSLCEISQAL
jgi:hypothetical protein